TLTSQLSGQAPLVPSVRTSTTDPQSPGHRDIDTRIKESESKLEDLLLRFTEKHPEVLALRATIGDLRARRQQELEALRAGGAGSGSMATSENPVYQDIQQQLSRLAVDMSAARAEVAQRERRIAELQRSIDTAPEVEAQLASLNRDYAVTKVQYESLLAGLQKARISESAEETGVIKFKIIEPPTAKSKPVGPKRVLMLIAVLMASIGGGIALAFALHQLKPVYSSISSITQNLSLPVLGTVSFGGTAVRDARLRADARLYSTASIALIMVFAAALIYRDWTSGLFKLLAG
ncbi:MAG: hypothetical protein EHM84_02355, partial [Lysobacterales bacterium]